MEMERPGKGDPKVAFINLAKKEISFKIVYYGPALGGKTTNLRYIYDHTPVEVKGKME